MLHQLSQYSTPCSQFQFIGDKIASFGLSTYLFLRKHQQELIFLVNFITLPQLSFLQKVQKNNSLILQTKVQSPPSQNKTQDTLRCLIISKRSSSAFCIFIIFNSVYKFMNQLSFIIQSKMFLINMLIVKIIKNIRKYKIMSKPIPIRDKSQRTFVMERQETQQSRIFDIEIQVIDNYVPLYHLFDKYCPLSNHKISIYSPDEDYFVSLNKIGVQKTAKIPISFFTPQVIMIRYKYRGDNASESQSSLESSIDLQKKQKKDRSKQRTIGQSIQLVKKWRSLHLNSNKSNFKKLTLQDAARQIGISKKSLDDYYYQLRLGQLYNFDFNQNLNEKIGILRSFVKQQRPQKQQKHKNMKHPKKLKIIQPDQYQQKIFKEQSISILQTINDRRDNSQNFFEEESQNIGSAQPFQNQMLSENFENDFFSKNFQFFLDLPNDPFLQIDRDFKKKSISEDDLFYF